MSDQKVQVTLTGDTSGLLQALQQAAKGTEALAASMEKSFGGVTSMLEGLAAPLMGFLGVLAGGHFLKEAISETAELGDAMAKGAQKAGVTVEALSGLAHAAKLSDVAFEDLVGGLGKLAKSMQTAAFTPNSPAAAAFKALGVEVEDVNGRLRPTEEMLGDLAERFSEMKDSAGKTALAMTIFGRGGAQMIPLLNEGKEGIAELTAEAQRLGITMTTEQAEASERYKDNLERLEAVVTGLKRRIGDELIPTLDELNTTLIEDGPEAVSVLGVAAKGLVTAFKTVGFVIGAVIQTIISLGATAGKALGGVWTGAQWAIAGQFGKAKDAITSGFHDAHLAMQAGDTVIQKDWEAFGLSLNRLWDPSLAQKAPRKKRGEGRAPGIGTESGDKPTDPYLAFEALMKAEAQVRKDRLALWDKHQADMAELMDGSLGKQVHEINTRYDEMLNRERSFGADEVTLKAIELKRDQEIEQAKTDFAKKQADERKRIAEEEAKEARRILEETGSAEQGFFDGIQQYLNRQGTVFQQWAQAAQQMLQGVENAFARGFHGILTGQMSFSQGLRSIWQGVTGAIIQMLAQLAAKWIVTAIAAKIFKDSASDAAKDNAVAQQESAASTLWATYSGIPFVGPAIAAGFIALMNASLVANAAGAKGIVGAADGGWFDRPTFAMVGEGKRPELVVPDVAFKDFATNLSANILAQERQAQAYGRAASGYAQAGASMGGSSQAQVIQHFHAPVWDPSSRGMRQLGEHAADGLKAYTRERSVVLRPGQVFGGL